MEPRVADARRIVASQLYDVSVCDHRIALDARLDRTQRTPPDDAARLLFERGLRFEQAVAASLGYPEVTVDGDWTEAAARTAELMRRGVEGIFQGVLVDGRFLARPDLLEKVDGVSALGDWLYVPGDIKSALAARTDAALQVGFAARLLEPLLGLRPSAGFLVLGDGARENIDLESIRCAVDDAVEHAVAVVDGVEPTRPFFSRGCSRCRWRGSCLPELRDGRDASFVFGMTRTTHRVLARHGVVTIDDLVSADAERMRRAGAPTDGLERLRRQASALLGGAALGKRAVDLPRGSRSEHYLRIETDPLDAGEPFLFCWGSASAPGGIPESVEAVVAGDADARARALTRLLSDLEAGARREEPIYVYGSASGRAFDRLAERLGLEPGRVGDLEGRMVDLAPWVRRAAALPVFFYGFAEVAAFARGRSRPEPDAPDDSLFVAFAGLGDGDDRNARRAEIESQGREAVLSLAAVRRWIG